MSPTGSRGSCRTVPRRGARTLLSETAVTFRLTPRRLNVPPTASTLEPKTRIERSEFHGESAFGGFTSTRNRPALLPARPAWMFHGRLGLVWRERTRFRRLGEDMNGRSRYLRRWPSALETGVKATLAGTCLRCRTVSTPRGAGSLHFLGRNGARVGETNQGGALPAFSPRALVLWSNLRWLTPGLAAAAKGNPCRPPWPKVL